jgi:hypothetical protein
MDKVCPPLALSAAVLLALFVAGCETAGGISGRTEEKSAVYATLKPWQKNYITKGVVVPGFTPDMVYMAVGNPSKVEPMPTSDGTKSEVWIYRNYYPSADAARSRYTPYNTDSPFQSAKSQTLANDADGSAGTGGRQVAVGVTPPPSIANTGGPQGGSLEPPDLRAFTLQVLFQDGKVVGVGMKPN